MSNTEPTPKQWKEIFDWVELYGLDYVAATKRHNQLHPDSATDWQTVKTRCEAKGFYSDLQVNVHLNRARARLEKALKDAESYRRDIEKWSNVHQRRVERRKHPLS